MVLLCVFSCGFYLYGTVGLCFLLGSGTRIIKKVWEKKSEILDDLINISPIHSLCVAFCFFLLVFSLGFMFAYLLSLGSSFVKRLADLGGHRCADFLGCLTIWGSSGGACQVFCVFCYGVKVGLYLTLLR